MKQHQAVEYWSLQVDEAERLNAAIWEEYQLARTGPGVRKSHFFEGRYENIYIEERLIPSLGPVLSAARQGARRFLGTAGLELKLGFWFNEMAPGDVTLPHDHDEDDELLAAAYYVRVPDDSGQLVLGAGQQTVTVTPVPGRVVFFRPGLIHRVTRNLSNEVRLSVGMNFGSDSDQV
jgi:hypothetical protein